MLIMNIFMRIKGLITDDIRNRDIKELSKRSSCSVNQGTKVSSDEEHNPDTSTPPRVRPISNTLPEQSWSPVSLEKAQYLQQVSNTLPKQG